MHRRQDEVRRVNRVSGMNQEIQLLNQLHESCKTKTWIWFSLISSLMAFIIDAEWNRRTDVQATATEAGQTRREAYVTAASGSYTTSKFTRTTRPVHIDVAPQPGRTFYWRNTVSFPKLLFFCFFCKSISRIRLGFLQVLIRSLKALSLILVPQRDDET